MATTAVGKAHAQPSKGFGGMLPQKNLEFRPSESDSEAIRGVLRVRYIYSENYLRPHTSWLDSTSTTWSTSTGT